MNILYFCNVNRLIPTEVGVMKKILAQIRVMNRNGFNVFLAAPDNPFVYSVTNSNGQELLQLATKGMRGMRKRGREMKVVSRFIKENNIDVVYSRYGFSFDFFLFYRFLHKQGISVLVEIPTYPISQKWLNVKHNLKQKNYLTALKQMYNVAIGSTGIPFFRFCVDRIVNNNGYERIWGIPVLQISNGIDIADIPERKHKYKKGDDIRLLAVANVAPWHGYDRLIQGLKIYYKENPFRRVYFDLIGPGLEIESLKKFVKKENLDKYVFFHGTVIGEELDNYFDNADLGVSVLGVHRNKMERCDSLKSREYCARKLPFITEEAEVQYKNKPYTLCVQSDDSPINVHAIIAFYDKITSNSSLLNDMYLYARNECSWDFAFKPVVDYLSNVSDLEI